LIPVHTRRHDVAKRTRAKVPDNAAPFVGAQTFFWFASLRPEDKLRRVLAYLSLDVGALKSAHLQAMGRMFQAVSPRPSEAASGITGWRIVVSPHPPPPAEVVRLHATLNAGIRGFLESGRWALGAPASPVLERGGDPGEVPKTRWLWEPASSAAAVTAGVADLVWSYADRVRACKRCRALFLATKRQEYCKPQHGQEARDQKKAQRKNEGK
jgi:hypothetical protein